MSRSALPAIGDVVAGHKIERVLGEGGVGVVYAAKNRHGFEAAIKVLRPEKRDNETAVEEFKNEAWATGSVDHKGVVKIFDHGEDDGLPYILMELVDGPPLDRQLEETGRIPHGAATKIAIQVAEALAHAHKKGLLHRDIKPGNILLYRDGRARLTDFGIVKDISSLKGYLVGGRQVGTAAYASPEQCLGKRLSHATDIYSLGATLYHMVCGRPPFPGGSRSQIMRKHVKQVPPAPNSIVPEIPTALSNAIEKMMAKRQTDRQGSMERIIHDLELIRSGKVAIAAANNKVNIEALKGLKRTRRPR